jgi:hypothetical protein
MQYSELESFVYKFRELWHSGMDAHLDAHTHDGKAWFSLHVTFDVPQAVLYTHITFIIHRFLEERKVHLDRDVELSEKRKEQKRKKKHLRKMLRKLKKTSKLMRFQIYKMSSVLTMLLQKKGLKVNLFVVKLWSNLVLKVKLQLRKLKMKLITV